LHEARKYDKLKGEEGCHGEHDGTGKRRPLLQGQDQMTVPQLPLTRIVPVIAHAVVVFGDEHKASHWLSTPLPLFGGRAPSELLATEDGIRLVEQTLTRIEHNIFS
jgi:uncharacterized protein (DUF2384 family)